MSSQNGLLCHKHGSDALAYKHGGSALIYKGDGGERRKINVIVSWTPKSFVCNTYHQEHGVEGQLSYEFTDGAGSGSAATAQSGDKTISISVSSAPAAIRVSLRLRMSCEANEYTAVKVRVMASQTGVSPIMKVLSPAPAADTTATATISVDGHYKLSGIQ